MSDLWKLTVVGGPDVGKSFAINKERPLVIGRGTDSDTKIRDQKLSRIHCEVRFVNGTFILTDRGSASGTHLNGQPISGECALHHGMIFQAGESKIKFFHDDPLDADTASPRAGSSQFSDLDDRASVEDTAVSIPAQLDTAAHSPKQKTTKPATPVVPISELPGKQLHVYRLDEIISSSSSSVVFKSYDTARERLAAVKVLRPQLTPDAAQQERFIRAMRTMAPVRHPYVVRLYEAGKRGGYCWAALEWIDGISVSEMIKQVGISDMLGWKDVWQVADCIGQALSEAEKLGITHRNVTPTNIIKRDDKPVYLLSDLIFARALDQTDAPQLTRPGDMLGELGYMAPERIFDATTVDARSDQFGLGATLYALLTGKPPYGGDDLAEVIDKLHNTTPVAPTAASMAVDERFSDLVMRMINPKPEKRFPGSRELLSELRRVGKLGGLPGC